MSLSKDPTGTLRNLLYVDVAPPTSMDEERWLHWSKTEHIHVLLASNLIARAALYKEVSLTDRGHHPCHHRYLALYQTDFRFLADNEKYKRMCGQTGAGGYRSLDNGAEVRNYRIVGDCDQRDFDRGIAMSRRAYGLWVVLKLR